MRQITTVQQYEYTHGFFSYLISDNVVFLTIADKSYPRKLAFSYLDELSKEFATTYGPKVEGVRKPYAFVGFGSSAFNFHSSVPIDIITDTFMSKTARLYQDTRAANAATSGLDKLNDDLQDVTRIMTKNMEELLWRGDSLDRTYLGAQSHSLLNLHVGMSHMSANLRTDSEKYRKAARNINLQALLRQYAPLGAIGLIIILFIYWRFF